jgi:hypothetical protein
MPHRTLESGWTEFAADILPADPLDEQVIDMRRSFFAGAAFMVHMMADIGRETVTEHEAAARFAEYGRELERFALLVRYGRR